MRKLLKRQTFKHLSRALILSGLCFFYLVGFGQESDSLRVINLNAVSVNALALETENLDFPGMVGIVDSIQILNTDQSILTNSLNKISGVYMQSGALNTNRITIRGIGSRTPFGTNKIRAFYGEIPLTDGGGETTIEDIDLRLVSNVEVQKGPNSSLYGAGLGGVILLEPNQTNKNQLSFNSSLGSFGTLKYGVLSTYTQNQQTSMVSYQKLQSDGYRDNNEFDRHSLNTSWQYANGRNKFNFLFLYVSQKAFIPSSIGETAFNENPKSAALTWAQARGFEDYKKSLSGFSWIRKLTDDLRLSSSMYAVWNDNYEPRPFNILDDEQTGGGVRTRLIFEGKELSYNVGFEAYGDVYDWKTYENRYRDFADRGSVQGDRLDKNSELRTYFNSFVHTSYRLTKSTNLESGLNVNTSSYRFQSEGNEEIRKTFKPILSPKISIIQGLGQSVNVFATLSHGFSPPSIEETLDSSGSFNADIQPETGWNREIGIKGAHPKFSYSVSAYSMKIKNLLVTRRTAEDVTFGKNAGRTLHNGLEVEAEALVWSERNAQITSSIAYNLALYEFKKFTDDGNDYSGNELTGVPKSQFNYSLNHQSKILFSGINFQFIDEMPITDDNSIYTDSFSLLNCYIGANIPLGENWTARSTFRLQNILNEKYASMINVNAQAFGGGEPRYYYPGLPRNGQLSLLISYVF